MPTDFPTPVARYVDAANTFDLDALVESFLTDALVNDIQREFPGQDAIRRWADREIIGMKVTMNVTDAREHYGDWILNAEMDGQYDKTDLPDPLVLTFYFSPDEDKISKLIILSNRPAD